MMDKLGLLSLQVPILANSTEIGSETTSAFMTTGEALPARYVSDEGAADAPVASMGESHSIEREAAAAEGRVSASFAASDSSSSSSSSSSCFWGDDTSRVHASDGRTSSAAAAALNCWIAVSADASALKVGTEKSFSSAVPLSLSISSLREAPSRRQMAAHAQQQSERNAEAGKAAAAAGGRGAGAAAAGENEHLQNRDWMMEEIDGGDQRGSSMEDSRRALAVVAALAAVERGISKEKQQQASGGCCRVSSREGDRVSRSSGQPGEATEGAAAEREGGAEGDSALETATSKTTDCINEDAPIFQTTVGGVDSCSKLEGGSADDTVCSTGTPTTRFSTEQEEDGVVSSAAPHGANGMAGAACSGGVSADDSEDTCGSSSKRPSLLVNGEVMRSPSYEGALSSEMMRCRGVDGAAAKEEMGRQRLEAEEADEDSRGEQQQQQQHQRGNSSMSTWHHGGGGQRSSKREPAGLPRHQHFRQRETLAHHDGSSFLSDEGTVEDLLAAAAVVVEQQLHTLSGGAAGAQKGRTRSEVLRGAGAAALLDDSTAAAAAAAARGCSNSADFSGSLKIMTGGREGGGGAKEAINGSTSNSVSLQNDCRGGETIRTSEALSLALAATLSDAKGSPEGGGGAMGEGGSSSDERRCAAAEADNGEERITGEMQNFRRQPSETTVAVESAAAAAAKGAGPSAATGGGGGGKGGVTRGAQQQQQANGGGRELTEDPELVACLKRLLTALPRKKDAEAKWLLSGEMQFVRPYALQIVDVWKIHLGEAGRTALKKDISERTQADVNLKRRVLAISKLKMATLEELVQIAELANLLVRTLEIANMYEAERQVASVTRQSASRRAVNTVAVASSSPSQSPSLATHNNIFHNSSNSTNTASGASASRGHSSSSSFALPGSSAGAATAASGSSGRSTSTSAQNSSSSIICHHIASYSPSHSSLVLSLSPPGVSSPRGQRGEGLSPRSRTVCSTSAVLSPRGGSSTAETAADEQTSLRMGEESSRHLRDSASSAAATEGRYSSRSGTSPHLMYESMEKLACLKAAGKPGSSMSSPATSGAVFSERKGGGGRGCSSPRSNRESRLYATDVPSSPSSSCITQRMQQQQSQNQPLQHQDLQDQQLHHQLQRHQPQPYADPSDEEIARCGEVDAARVAQELRETLSVLQQSAARVQRGKELLALPPPPASSFTSAKAASSRGEIVSPSPEWAARLDRRGVPELRQEGNTKKKKTSTAEQPRRSQEPAECMDKDEEALSTAELLAAFIDSLRPVPAELLSHPQIAAADTSSSSTMANEDLLTYTLEAAATNTACSPRGRALASALTDSQRLARIVELAALLYPEDSGIGALRRRLQQPESSWVLRMANSNGEEGVAASAAARLLSMASHGSTSSSSSEAEGAAPQDREVELTAAGRPPLHRKRVRRSNKAEMRNGNKSKSVGSSRAMKQAEADPLFVQHLQQQLLQLEQQQQHARESLEAPTALGGEVHKCMNTPEAEAEAAAPTSKQSNVFSQGREATVYGGERRSGERKPHVQDTTQDEDTEEEEIETRAKTRVVSATADAIALLQSSDRSQYKRPPPASSSSQGALRTAGNGMEQSNGAAVCEAAGCDSLQSTAVVPKAAWQCDEARDSLGKTASKKGRLLFNGEREERHHGGSVEVRRGSSAELRPLRRENEDEEEANCSGAAVFCEDRTTPRDAAETDAVGRGASGTRSAARSDLDSESRSSITTSRRLSRGGTYRSISATDAFAVISVENNSCSRGRSGVRNGGDSSSAAAPYNTRRSAAAAAAGAFTGIADTDFADPARSGTSSGSSSFNSNGGSSRLAVKGGMQCEAERKDTTADKTDIGAGGGGGAAGGARREDPVAEKCAKEAKQLLERALKVNDSLGFLPSSCRLIASGISREQETTTSSGNNCATGLRGKRAREQSISGDIDTGAFLQILATVCLMYMKS